MTTLLGAMALVRGCSWCSAWRRLGMGNHCGGPARTRRMRSRGKHSPILTRRETCWQHSTRQSTTCVFLLHLNLQPLSLLSCYSRTQPIRLSHGFHALIRADDAAARHPTHGPLATSSGSPLGAESVGDLRDARRHMIRCLMAARTNDKESRPALECRKTVDGSSSPLLSLLAPRSTTAQPVPRPQTHPWLQLYDG